jgi:hypothetical protein
LITPCDHLRRSREGAHQVAQWLQNFQNDASSAFCDQRHVATELDNIAKTLLAVE